METEVIIICGAGLVARVPSVIPFFQEKDESEVQYTSLALKIECGVLM